MSQPAHRASVPRLEQQEKIKSLENELNVYAAYNTVDKKIIPELKVLYPAAEAIAMAKNIQIIWLAMFELELMLAIVYQHKIAKKDEAIIFSFLLEYFDL